MEVIKVNNLSKAFINIDNLSILDMLNDKNLDKTTILKNINFSLEKGKFLGVLGKNGAGKSTLLKTLSGIYSPDEGKIIILGKIASIFELGSFYNLELTGERYCRDYLGFFGILKKNIANILVDIQKFTELDKFFFEPIKTYSSGMQAKLLFAVVTSLKADIILIDEFLVVGDEYFQGKAWRRLKGFLSKGASGVMVSHDWVSLMKLTQYSMIIEKNNGISFIGETYKTVQKYLNISYESSEEISFFNPELLLSTTNKAVTNEIFNYNFEVKIHDGFTQKQFATGLTIEKYEVGAGWSLLYLCTENIDIIDGKSIYKINISIHDFTLTAGNYIIAIFLNEPVKKGQINSNKAYEQLSWTNGKAIKLIVEDKHAKTSQSLFKKKALWQIIK